MAHRDKFSTDHPTTCSVPAGQGPGNVTTSLEWCDRCAGCSGAALPGRGGRGRAKQKDGNCGFAGSPSRAKKPRGSIDRLRRTPPGALAGPPTGKSQLDCEANFTAVGQAKPRDIDSMEGQQPLGAANAGFVVGVDRPL